MQPNRFHFLATGAMLALASLAIPAFAGQTRACVATRNEDDHSVRLLLGDAREAAKPNTMITTTEVDDDDDIVLTEPMLMALGNLDLAAMPLGLAPQVRVVQSGNLATTGRGSFLGVDVCEVDKDRVKALNLREERGVEITRVQDDSPAAKAGLKTNDVVLEFNGQRVEGTEQFIRLVRETPAGREVKINIVRGGQPMTVAATVGTRKAMVFSMGNAPEFTLPEMPPMPAMPDVPRAYMSWRSPYLGIEGESLSPQLAEFFGVKEGVLVRSVAKNTAAEKYGLKAGDVITKVDTESVSSPKEITEAIRSLKGKKTFPVTLMREKRETTINVTLEEDAMPSSRAPRPAARRVTAHQFRM